ncbi:MAG: GreA/GreB family elongation factor [Candidatus Limnocylindrales bacterium]
MIRPAVARSFTPHWPMTSQAWRRLEADVEVMAGDVARMANGPEDESTELATHLVLLPVELANRRLDRLRDVLDRAAIVDAPDRAVIGRVVVIREADGSMFDCQLVPPGEGDPVQGLVSVDSPFGSSILGRSPGQVVEIAAPAGRRSVEIEAIDEVE